MNTIDKRLAERIVAGVRGNMAACPQQVTNWINSRGWIVRRADVQKEMRRMIAKGELKATARRSMYGNVRYVHVLDAKRVAL